MNIPGYDTEALVRQVIAALRAEQVSAGAGATPSVAEVQVAANAAIQREQARSKALQGQLEQVMTQRDHYAAELRYLRLELARLAAGEE